MTPSQQELVWEGRTQLGDEPGTFGDAAYSGIAVEYPITIVRSDPKAVNPVTLTIATEHLETFSGYPGHKLTVAYFEEDPKKPLHWIESVLLTDTFTGGDHNRKTLKFDLTSKKTSPLYISLMIEADTTVKPGLYNDFVIHRITFASNNFEYYAMLGFRA